MDTTIRVAVPAPLFRCFDYLAPMDSSTPVVGARVRVPFGRRHIVGVVTATDVAADIASNKLRRIHETLDTDAALPAHLQKLIHWTAHYYHHPIGEVYAAALPANLRKGKPAQRNLPQIWRLTESGRRVEQDQPANAPRQRQVMAILRARDMPDTELRAQLPNAAAVLRRLVDHGLIERITAQAPTGTPDGIPGPALNAEQAEAVAAVKLDDGFVTTLLQGVTGSGKTEVYLHLIKNALAAGRQVLVLVPEIGLTPQLVTRFTERLGFAPAMLHSGMTASQRLDAWLAARDGHVRVILGTRSAIFTSLDRPGLIIVDEEHDQSYKQQDGLRYSARDLAVRCGQMARIPVVLGSATPALESLQNVAIGRYQHLTLNQRAGGATPPHIQLLDVRSRPLEQGVSRPLLDRVRSHIEGNGQALLFINRRGFAPVLVCHDCGWTAPCRRCDTGMTVYRGGRSLRCHHCGSARPADTVCESCGGDNLVAAGEGTERVTSALRAQLPGVAVARFDRDTTTGKGKLEQLLSQVRAGDIQVLVGTQMLAKGHDFPNLTFVGVINADHGLFSSDFRAFERMAQLVTQVAGRAGRGATTGEVMLQTRHPDHPMLHTLVHSGYDAYARAALSERADASLPPFGHLALLTAESPQQESPYTFLDAAIRHGETLSNNNVAFWGPAPAPLERRAGRYRAHLLIHAEKRPALHRFLETWTPQLSGLSEASKVRWSLDVDPQDLI